MKLEDLAVLKDTALPLLAGVSDIVSRIIDGYISASEAMEELKKYHTILGERIKQTDSIFEELDKKNDERVK